MSSARAEPSSPIASLEVRSGSILAPKALWAYARQLFVLGLFFFTALVVSLVSTGLAFFGRSWMRPATWQRLIGALFRWWLALAVRIGVFKIEFPRAAELRDLKGLIVAANHPSLLDAVMLLAELPSAVCIMRASLIENPAFGGAARLAGYITNDSGTELIRQGVEKLSQGETIVIFPEGTRTHSLQPVNPFKKGFALIATRAATPIQTVFIERHGPYLSKGVSFFYRAPLPISYHVHLGEMVQPTADENAKDLSARLEQYFASHLENTGEAVHLIKPVSH